MTDAAVLLRAGPRTPFHVVLVPVDGHRAAALLSLALHGLGREEAVGERGVGSGPGEVHLTLLLSQTDVVVPVEIEPGL